jgi:hypothetical protein
MYTGISLSVKNLWGCIPSNRDRLLLHPWIGEILDQLADAVRAKFALVDGRYGLNRNGPLRGDPMELGWMMAADDLYAADRTACRIMQIDWRRIDHLRRPGRQNPATVRTNRNPADFQSAKFYLRRELTDWPGWLAFRIPWLARLAYVSPAAGLLHRLLYLVRTPFYDYSQSYPISDTAGIAAGDSRARGNPPTERGPHASGS